MAGGHTVGGGGSRVGGPQISISTLVDSVSLSSFFFFPDNSDFRLRRETAIGGGGDVLGRL